MSNICDSPFNSDFKRFNDISDAIVYMDNYNNQCLLPKIDYTTKNINKFMNQYENENNNLITAEQTNKETMHLYQNDYYYVIFKGIIYLIVLGIFIYFFGINNLINRIKTTGVVLKDKAVNIKDKAMEIKDNIKTITEPKLS